MASSERLYPVLLVVPETPSRLKGPEKVSFLRNQARQALAISAQKSGLFLKSLDQAENGAPLPSGGVYWSLSHKESVVGAVAASMPVGIDVERIRPRSEALFKRIADAREWELSEGGDRLVRFYQYWTAKEAVLKAAGDGLRGLSGCRVEAVCGENRTEVAYRGRLWEVQHFFFPGHAASIAGGASQISWILVR